RMDNSWTPLGPADSFPIGEPTIHKTTGHRLVVIRDPRDEAVHVLDDQCPHEGYPLSQGTLREGVLTCAWHNWKFDICTGNCTTGGDQVRRYPTRIRSGVLEADLKIDVTREQARLVSGIRQGLFENDQNRTLRDALRLEGLSRGDASPFAVMAEDSANRSEWGFGHSSAALADVVAWVDDRSLSAAEGLAVGAELIGELLMREPRRSTAAAGSTASNPSALPADGSTLHDALQREAVDEAEAIVRGLSTDRREEAIHGVVAFLSTDLIAYGHGAIYLLKALELAWRFPSAADDLLASATVSAGWGTRETALPPFRYTHRALESWREAPGSGSIANESDYLHAVLEGERSAVDATRAALKDGASAVELLRLSGRAAAHRLRAYDPTWEKRDDVAVTVLDVSHAVTFAEAAQALLPFAEGAAAGRLALQAAAFVGKLEHAGPDRSTSAARSDMSLDDALAHRDENAARGALRDVPVDAAFRRLRPFAALDAAVRPIFIAHTIKTTEALHRMAAKDPRAERTYLDACLHMIVPRLRERFHRRNAKLATKFVADGRPPAGLY
ncbi:MAG: Rieske (2Fe-2S) protein, partial [Myxococcota bacterium]